MQSPLTQVAHYPALRFDWLRILAHTLNIMDSEMATTPSLVHGPSSHRNVGDELAITVLADHLFLAHDFVFGLDFVGVSAGKPAAPLFFAIDPDGELAALAFSDVQSHG